MDNLCRSVTELPPSNHTASFTPINPSKPPSSTVAQTTAKMRDKAMKAPIRTLYATEASDLLEQAFKRSVFLTDSHGWGHIRIEQALQKLVRHHTWIARRFEDSRYLIEAPSPHWLESTLGRGSIILDNIFFKVTPWDPCYTEGLRMIPYWIRITGFPMKFWQWEELKRCLLNLVPRSWSSILGPGTKPIGDLLGSGLGSATLCSSHQRTGSCTAIQVDISHDSISSLRLNTIMKQARPGAWIKKPTGNDPVKSSSGTSKGVAISERSTTTEKPQKTSSAPAGKGKGLAPQEEGS